MGKGKTKGDGQTRVEGGIHLLGADLQLRDLVGSLVVVGFLIVFIVAAFRLPADRLYDILQTAASPLAIIIVTLFGNPRAENKHSKDDDR